MEQNKAKKQGQDKIYSLTPEVEVALYINAYVNTCLHSSFGASLNILFGKCLLYYNMYVFTVCHPQLVNWESLQKL